MDIYRYCHVGNDHCARLHNCAKRLQSRCRISAPTRQPSPWCCPTPLKAYSYATTPAHTSSLHPFPRLGSTERVQHLLKLELRRSILPVGRTCCNILLSSRVLLSSLSTLICRTLLNYGGLHCRGLPAIACAWTRRAGPLSPRTTSRSSLLVLIIMGSWSVPRLVGGGSTSGAC